MSVQVESQIELDEYIAELRERVCRHCIVRRDHGPPCDATGLGCGIEKHVPELVALCRSLNSPFIDPYGKKLDELICKQCELRETPNCPCPLHYLLPLAVEAVEVVEARRKALTTA